MRTFVAFCLLNLAISLISVAQQLEKSTIDSIFITALDLQTPPVDYEITTDQQEGKYIVGAYFSVNSDQHYQVIGLTWYQEELCDSTFETGLIMEGFGPGGGGFRKDFCQSNLKFSLSHAELMSDKETSHGINFDSLLAEIRTLIVQRE